MTSHLKPPRAAERLLFFALAGSPYRHDILGDLHETFAALCSRRSPAFARWWYRVQALRLAARFILRARPARTKGQPMDRFLMDVRFAARSISKRPFLTAAVVATLALAIGANAAVFGVVDALLLHPFDMHDVDRIVMPVTTSPRFGEKRETVSPADFLDWQHAMQGGPIEHLAAINWWDANLVGRDEPERVLGFAVSPEFFAALDAHAAIGRTFLPEEAIPANAKRVVLSDGLWRRRFGGDAGIVGRTILIDAELWTVVGVMPPKFDFPMRAELWAPLAFDEKEARNRSSHYLTVIGRLRAGQRPSDAQTRMSTIVRQLALDYPAADGQLGAAVYSLGGGMSDVGVPRVLSLWQAAGVFVLLIACANIANLLLARAAEREREIAIRVALGSSRGRIVRGAILESAMLVGLALPAALAVASASLRVMHAFMPAGVVRFIPGWDRMGLSPSTVAATVVFAGIAAAAFGIVPAWHLAKGAVSEALKSDARAGVGPGRHRVRRALVVVEVALALPLLVAAVLSASTITTFITSWQGYDPDNVLTMRVVLPAATYADAGRRSRFALAAVGQLAAMPGAAGAAVGNILPAVDSNAVRSIEIAGRLEADRSKAPRVDYRTVSTQYFDVLRMPLVAGRAFAATDRAESEPVAIVSASMAHKFWPGASALDQRLRLVDGPWMRVVGVCGDVVHDWFDSRNVPTLYRPIAQAPGAALMFAVKTAAEPLTLAPAARAAIARIDPTQPTFDVMTLRQVVAQRTISLDYIASVMAAFAGLALVLAVLGLYAVMTYLVAQRAREIGVRMALGATEADVQRDTIGQAGRLTAIGLAIGLVLAVALGRAMEAGLLGLVSADFRVTAALAAALGLTAIAGSYLPARRAARIDPIVALRSE